MDVTDFDYDLPKELIAQTPVEPRDSSRLLVMDKNTGELEHQHFYNLPEYLKPGDLLVFNDTRVIPARLHGFKTTGAHVEVFLLTRKNATDWEVLVKPGKKLQNINLLSGGEKTLTAIALMFAVLKAKPTPFCILDEVEAALDDANIDRFINCLRKLTGIQFALVTHQKATMEHADAIFGVTMPEKGISKVLSLSMTDDF